MQDQNVLRVKTTALIFNLASVVVYILWAIFPLLNGIYYWQNSTGEQVSITYGIAWWFVAVVSLNILLPFLSFMVILRPQQTSQADVYFIFSTLLMFINAFLVLTFLFYWLFWSNTFYSGRTPFNDYHWCCEFVGDNPDLCANNLFAPCDPAVTALRINDVLIGHIAFTSILFLFSIGHFAVGKLFRITGFVVQNEDAEKEGRAFGLAIILINVLVFIYWAAVPLLNTLYFNGYPRFAIPPPPNNFVSTLYGFQWWLVFLLCLNIIPIAFFMLGLVSNRNFFVPWIQYWSAVTMIIISLFCFLVFIGILIFDCNWSFSSTSICNDYHWCCKFYAMAPLLCGNVGGCPGVTTLILNSEFLQHIIFSLVFIIFGGIQIWMNVRMKRYGVFYTN